MGAAAVLNSVRDPCPRGVRSDQPEGAFLPILVITRVIGGSPAIVDPHITTDGPARLLQPLQECPDACLRFRIVRGEVREYANALHARPLRARRQRPRGRRAAEQRDERAAFHSITSSARASSDGGIVSPSAFAVLRLMISSKIVGCSIGRSAGFAPLRIRSTK